MMSINKANTAPENATRISALHYLLAIVLGMAGFFLFANSSLLNPTNFSWVANGDPAANYIGWRYFAISDWSFPPGLNPDFGLDLSRSIVFSDALPLLAFPFKAISGFLPDGFHYFGLWLMVIFVIQAIAAWKLIAMFTRDTATILLSSAFFVSAPALLHRLMFEATMHIALSSHFLILMAMYLLFQQPENRSPRMWFLLLLASLLIHFYLFVIVGLFWMCALIIAARAKTIDHKTAFIELAAGTFMIMIVGWLAGYFAGSGVGAQGYGFYKTNLLSLFDPSGWSYILPDLPEGRGDYEGFNYLGLGILLAGLLAFYILVTKKIKLPNGGFWRIFPFIALALFAVTFYIGIGALVIAIPYPDFIDRIAGILRASGRMFWPAYYAIILGILYLIVTGLPRNIALPVLAATLIIQLADTSAYWAGDQNPLNVQADKNWATNLNDPFWDEAGPHYEKIILTKPTNATNGWRDFSTIGLRHKLATNAIYISRISEKEIETARQKTQDQIIANGFDKDTLYIIHADDIAFAEQHIKPDTDLMLEIDGHMIVAPNWQQK